MLKPIFIAVGLIGVATGTHAQTLNFNMNSTDQCIAANEETPTQCIGASSDHCVNNTEGGYSTVIVGGCLNAEFEAWDQRLNAAYQRLVTLEKAADQRNADIPNAPKTVPALKEMQRAWIKFRDAKCAYEVSRWGGGTGAGPAFAACLMDETGGQALYLQRMITDIEGW